MRKLLPLLVGGLAVVAAPVQAADRPDPETQLARALEGRVAGEPVDCINLRNVRSSTIIQDTAILYRVGNTIYLNRPRSGAESLDRSDTMVTRLNSTQLCSIDTIRMVDPVGRFMTGIVFLGEFVPYRRAE